MCVGGERMGSGSATVSSSRMENYQGRAVFWPNNSDSVLLRLRTLKAPILQANRSRCTPVLTQRPFEVNGTLLGCKASVYMDPFVGSEASFHEILKYTF